MRQFLQKLLVFTFPILSYCVIAALAMPTILSWQNGPSTHDQISYSFKNAVKDDYDLYILGNSRTYRGLDPSSFKIRSYNFSHDNDSFNQIYYKLDHLLRNGKNLKYIVLGIDYFQFSFKADTRNYIYSSYFSDKYAADFDQNSFDLQLKYYFDNIHPRKLLAIQNDAKLPVIKANGQFVTYAVATENDAIDRDINRLDFQVEYFRKILKLCKANQIKIFMTMLPVRKNELKSYSVVEIDEFKDFISKEVDNENAYYLDYSSSTEYSTSDYTDITHFNERAAKRFSQTLSDTISQIVDGQFQKMAPHRSWH